MRISSARQSGFGWAKRVEFEINWRFGIILCISLFLAGSTSFLAEAQVVTSDRTYTTCGDFVRGDIDKDSQASPPVPLAVEIVDQTVDPQCDPDGDGVVDPPLTNSTDALIQLPSQNDACPFLWIPNSNEDTVSKINTRTGVEVARYRTGPENAADSFVLSPSRTTVDLDCNLWLGNRAFGGQGSVLKVGLKENDSCVDRNGNGVIDTSTGPTDVKPWPKGASIGQDECVLIFQDTGKHNTDEADGGIPRAIAIDKDNNVWVGLWGEKLLLKLDGRTGAILDQMNLNIDQTQTRGYRLYGAVVDEDGFLWAISNYDKEKVDALIKIDLSHKTITPCIGPSAPNEPNFVFKPYGMALDADGNIWVTEPLGELGKGRVARVRRSDCATQIFFVPAGSDFRGIAIDNNKNIWIAAKGSGSVVRLKTDGTFVADIPVGVGPRGVAVDQFGKIWAPNYDSNNVSRIDPAINQVNLTVPVGLNPYTYSDMTGYVVRNFTVKTGTWTVIRDSKDTSTRWRRVTWTSNEPSGTSVTVRVRVSDTIIGLSSAEYMDVTNGGTFLKQGRYIQVEARLTTTKLVPFVTPRLKDISLFKNRPPTPPNIPSISQVPQCSGVTLEGDTNDPDGDPVTFLWELIEAPDGIRVPQTLSRNKKLTFFFTQPGLYRLRLTVSDNQGGSSTVETSINVFPSLGCGFLPGKTDFDIMLNALVHQIYEITVDVNSARNFFSQNRSDDLIASAVERALDLLEQIPAQFAELLGQLDNIDESLTNFLAIIESRFEDPDGTPAQLALLTKVKNKIETMQRTLLEMRNELDSLRDTLDAGDANVADVRQALEQALQAINDGDLESAKSHLNDAYRLLRVARREQARVLAKEKIVKKRFVEINGILPRAFAVLNEDPKVIPAMPSAQPIRLQTKGSISLWVLSQRDGSFTLQAQSADVKNIRLEMYALSGERLVLRSANGNVVTVKPTDAQGRALANGVYLMLITVETRAHQTERQVHKITVLQN